MKDRCRDRGKYRFTGTRYIRKGTTEERDRHKDKKVQRTDTVVDKETDKKRRDRCSKTDLDRRRGRTQTDAWIFVQ